MTDALAAVGMEVERFPVPTATRGPGGTTNAYVVGATDALLVDPAGRTEALDRTVDERGVAAIAVTHTHPDHVGAIAEYAGETGATVWALGGRADRFAEATGVQPERTFGPGDAISAGDGLARVLLLPGHAPDHVGFVTDAGILVGDCAVDEGSVVVDADEGDMRAYLTSLRRLHSRDPPRLFPGHGPTIEDPRPTLERLIAHRLDRERRVLAAVRGGARTTDGIVEAAYDKDLEGVVDLARSTVIAHLQKLAVEGRIRWDGQRAAPR